MFEHPKGAKSWHEAEVKEVEQLEGVQVVECDMCMFGLRVRHGLNKKPTWLMTNCELSRENESYIRNNSRASVDANMVDGIQFKHVKNCQMFT